MEQNSGLAWSLKNGDLEEVQRRIDENKDNLTTEIAGRFPIHHAADCGQLDIIQYLLEKGTDINIKDKHGLTALHSAVFEGHTKCVELLLQKGATKEPAPDGAPLITCTEDPKIIELLK